MPETSVPNSSSPTPLREAFLAGVAAELRDAWAADAALGAALEQLLSAGQQRWPRLRVDPAAFLGWVGRRIRSRAGSPELAELRAGDLLLAFACAGGQPEALAAFDAEYLPAADFVFGRGGVRWDMTDDARQLLRERLFVAQGGEPRIAQYDGRHELRHWIKVIGGRVAISLARQESRAPRVTEDELLDLPLGHEHPELTHFKRLYREEFKAAFRDALEAIPQEHRLLLQRYHFEGNTLETLSRTYGVHLSTLSRRLDRARGILVRCLRNMMIQRLQVNTATLDSVMRLVESRLSMPDDSATRSDETDP